MSKISQTQINNHFNGDLDSYLGIPKSESLQTKNNNVNISFSQEKSSNATVIFNKILSTESIDYLLLSEKHENNKSFFKENLLDSSQRIITMSERVMLQKSIDTKASFQVFDTNTYEIFTFSYEQHIDPKNPKKFKKSFALLPSDKEGKLIADNIYREGLIDKHGENKFKFVDDASHSYITEEFFKGTFGDIRYLGDSSKKEEEKTDLINRKIYPIKLDNKVSPKKSIESKQEVEYQNEERPQDSPNSLPNLKKIMEKEAVKELAKKEKAKKADETFINTIKQQIKISEEKINQKKEFNKKQITQMIFNKKTLELEEEVASYPRHGNISIKSVNGKNKTYLISNDKQSNYNKKMIIKNISKNTFSIK